jgi:predicted amidophosphoribosyltransferase
LTSWTGFLKTLLTRSADLLGPPDARCLVCGGRRGGSPARSLDGWLCADCQRRIPWIRRIACPRCGRPVFCPDCVRQPVRAFEMNRSAVRYSDEMKAWLKLYKFRGDERYGGLLAEMLFPAYVRLTAEAAAASGRADKAAIAGTPEGGQVQWPNRSGEAGRRCGSGMFDAEPARPVAGRRSGRGIWHAVTCVPVSRERAEERGFNHAERLARAAAEWADAPLLPLIRRLVDGGKQSQRGRAERLRAMRAVFASDEAEIRRLAARVVRTGLPPGEPLRILLVDDIYTTGATSEACAMAIRAAAPCPVRIYVLTWARS